MESAEKPSLYDRLGGVYSIASVVDDFIDRVMVRPQTERQSFGRRSAPSGAACGIQVLGDRDGLLGDRRPAKIHGQVDGGVALPFEDYQHGVGGILGRFSADDGQVRGSNRRTSGIESDCQQYPWGYCLRF